jgi:hypothetical protein
VLRTTFRGGKFLDDPDARIEAAEAAAGPLPQARARRKPPNPKAPYHQELDPDHEDELLLSIGRGLALIERRENDSPASIVKAIAGYVDGVHAGTRRLTRDPTDAALALACVFGQQVCRELGWGWAHLRRTRAPGIVVISPDFRRASGPRSLVDAGLQSAGGGRLLEQYFARLRDTTPSPSERELYVRVR